MARKNKNKEYENFVPFDKANKREQRKRNNEKRNTWEINPATKVVPDKRKKKEKYKRDNYYEDYDEDYNEN